MNHLQVFPQTPNVSFATINTASPYQGDINTKIIFTAGPKGSFINQITVRPLGTNVATVMRFYLDDGVNMTLIHEWALSATTATETAAIGVSSTNLPYQVIPEGHTIKVALGTAVAAGLAVTVWGEDY